MSNQIIANADIISLFIIALSAAFSHCYGMCGGIVLAFSQNLGGSFFARFFLHLLYNLGRISTYILIGAICAYFGAKIAISDSARGGIFIIVGFVMILFGFGYFCAPKILAFFEPNIGNLSIFKKAITLILRRKNPLNAYFLGFLNGILPCGIVYFFAMNAMLSGSIFGAIKIMAIFGIATIIPMLLLGVFSSILALSKFKNIIMKISAILIILFGIWTIFRGFGILFK